MPTLYNLSTSEGDIKIIQRSARQYYEIGTILLNDCYGERVDVMKHDEKERAKDIMRQVYKVWLAEDTNCSWAYSIEQHFGLPSPQHESEGMWTCVI